MIPRKVVERAIRSLPLLLLPILLIPALIYALRDQTPSYVASAAVWATDPAALRDPSLGYGQDGSRYASPAQRQSQVIGDLLRTRTFREEVAFSAGLLRQEEVAAMSTSEADAARGRADRAVARAVAVRTAGVNLVLIFASDPSPEVAQGMVTATIQRYQERAANEVQRQTEIAGEYYSQQIAIAQTELQRRQTEVTNYLATRPRPTPAPGVIDSQLLSLQGKVGGQENVVEELKLALQRANLDAATSAQNLDARFYVQDPPKLPDAPTPVGITRRLGIPLIGFGLGFFLACAYLYITYRTDHTLRSSEDFAGIAVPLLGYLPTVRPKWYRRVMRKNRRLARRLAAQIASGDVGGRSA